MFNRIATALLVAAFCFVASPGTTLAKDTWSTEFAENREKLMTTMAKELDLPTPGPVKEFFDLATDGDWEKTTAKFSELKKIRLGEGDEAEELDSVLWQLVLETHGAMEQEQLWDDDLLVAYKNEILVSLPRGAIYFGGTDPGRFVPTAFQALRKSGDLFILTQNALADTRYLEYVRYLYGEEIWLPGAADAKKALRDLANDAKAGKVPSGAGVSIKNNKLRLQGAQGVMMISAKVAQQIFEKNKDQHEFFVEESYVLPWMFPYLEPHGLIFKLNKEPVEVTAKQIAEDQLFWDANSKKMMTDNAFLENPAARRAYSKMRGANAGLYVFWKRTPEAIRGYQQALRMFPDGKETYFRLANLFLRTGEFQKAQAVMNHLLARNPEHEQAKTFLAELKKQSALNDRRVALEGVFKKGASDVQGALDLLTIYGEMNRRAQFNGLTKILVENEKLPTKSLLRVIEICNEHNRLDLIEDALQVYLQRDPKNGLVHIDLALVQVGLFKPTEAVETLEKAVALGGKDIKKRIAEDKRFAPLKDVKAFRDLLKA